jgi:hypothetical protein
MPTRDEHVSVFVAAGRLGLSAGFLKLARRAGYGPPYSMVNGNVIYHWPAVARWAKERGFQVPEANRDPLGVVSLDSSHPTG